jgi:vitamin B12 transporter
VVTKEDIELMNAHTLADVLYGVNGVEVDPGGGPGSLPVISIQGSEFRHVAVFVDGILINTLGDNVADVGSVPVQMIERVEIIKGPASSVWGSSLGGVVNVITKGPGSKQMPGGTLSASYGTKDTEDYRAETYGNKGNFGYYAYAGHLFSNGLTPGFDASGDFGYVKMNYDFPADAKLLFSAFYGYNKRGQGESESDDYVDRQTLNQFFSQMSFTSPLGREVNLEVSARSSLLDSKFTENILSTGGGSYRTESDDTVYGASAKLTWKPNNHTVVFGGDYDHQKVKVNDLDELYGSDSSGEESQGKKAVYLNDTILWNVFSVTPGIRYDDSKTVSDFISPSLGITYAVAKNTLLSGYVARGFNSPTLTQLSMDNEFFGYEANPGLQPERIWSYQLGVETGALKFLWLKLQGFRDDIKDVIVSSSTSDPTYFWTFTNDTKQRREGIEIDFRTLPFRHFTLSGGATFIHAEDPDTGQDIPDVPKYEYDVALKYDDGHSLKGLLRMHYIWWNTSEDFMGRYNSPVVDLNLVKGLIRRHGSVLEGFLSAHNIFNGAQYQESYYKNPGRWFEAGMRLLF